MAYYYYYALACHSPEMRVTVGVNTVTAIFDRKLALTARRKLALTARTSVRASDSGYFVSSAFILYSSPPPSRHAVLCSSVSVLYMYLIELHTPQSTPSLFIYLCKEICQFYRSLNQCSNCQNRGGGSSKVMVSVDEGSGYGEGQVEGEARIEGQKRQNSRVQPEIDRGGVWGEGSVRSVGVKEMYSWVSLAYRWYLREFFEITEPREVV